MDIKTEDKAVAEKQDTLLVLDKEKNKVEAVKGIDKNGELQTVPPEQKHNNDFLKLDRGGDVASNFLKNFISQLKNPTRFEFFKADRENIDKTAKQIKEHVKSPTDSSKAELDKIRVDVDGLAPKKQKQSDSIKQIYKNSDKYFVNPNKIDWDSLKNFGISRKQIENHKDFESMLRGQKSSNTFEIKAKMDNVAIKSDARISFRPNKDDEVVLAIHGVRKQPELNRPYFGHEFSKQDRENLLKTGNMGRVVDIKNYYTGETNSSFISVDKLTNELVSMKANRLSLPDKIGGVKFNEEQKNDLKQGKAVWMENMTSSKNTLYSASLQVNADKGSLEFIFPDNKQRQSRGQSQRDNQDGVRIPKSLAGIELTEKQQNDLKSDKTIYVKGMKDRAGQEYNAYINVNHKDNKLDFFRFNPDKAKQKAKEITPANEHKTKVAVNSDGKTNEAIKKIDEPLKKGQSKPTTEQSRKQNKEETKKNKLDGTTKKSKGRKM